MHRLLQPHLKMLENIDSVLTSIPDGLPDPNVYQEYAGEWNIEWYHSPEDALTVCPSGHEVLWFNSVNGLTSVGNFKYGSPFPTELTTAIKALQEKANG